MGYDSLSGNRGPDKVYTSSCWNLEPNTAICRFDARNSLFQISASHSLQLIASDSSGKRWVDYANYEYVATLDVLAEYEIPCVGPGPPHFIGESVLRVGSSFVDTWWKP